MARKRMNGMGSITKMSGNRRKPYKVKKTVGFKEGKQIFVNIGCFATKKEAEEALAKYIVNPINMSLEKLPITEHLKTVFLYIMYLFLKFDQLIL